MTNGRLFNVILTSAVKLNLVKFYSNTNIQTLHLASTCSTIQLLVDIYLKDIHRQNMC